MSWSGFFRYFWGRFFLDFSWIFLMEFFWRIFRRNFLGGFFGRIFLGGFSWEEFFVYIWLLKSAKLFESERDWCFCQDFVSMKKEGRWRRRRKISILRSANAGISNLKMRTKLEKCEVLSLAWIKMWTISLTA